MKQGLLAACIGLLAGFTLGAIAVFWWIAAIGSIPTGF